MSMLCMHMDMLIVVVVCVDRRCGQLPRWCSAHKPIRHSPAAPRLRFADSIGVFKDKKRDGRECESLSCLAASLPSSPISSPISRPRSSSACLRCDTICRAPLPGEKPAVELIEEPLPDGRMVAVVGAIVRAPATGGRAAVLQEEVPRRENKGVAAFSGGAWGAPAILP